MAYDKHTWTCDEPITVERLNHIEDGIANAGGGDCGFECEEGRTTLTEETVTTTAQGGMIGGSLSYSQFINAETIRVTFNGVEYECPRIALDSTDSIYGGFNPTTMQPEFSVYPFSIASANGANDVATETAGTYTVKIEIVEETITTTPCFDKARGYSCEEERATLTEESVTTAAQGNYNIGTLSYSQFIEADTLIVTFDGVEYECPRVTEGSDNAYGGFGQSGPDFSEYPFVIITGSANEFYTETAGTYSVKIEAVETTVTTTPCFEKARGYWCEEGIVTLTEETVTTTMDGDAAYGNLSYSQLIDAESIKVTFNGTVYECEKTVNAHGDAEYGAPYNGSTNTFDWSEYPFNVFDNNLATETAGTYTIKIEAMGTTVATTPCFENAVKAVIPSSVEVPKKAYEPKVFNLTSEGTVTVPANGAATLSFPSTGTRFSQFAVIRKIDIPNNLLINDFFIGNNDVGVNVYNITSNPITVTNAQLSLVDFAVVEATICVTEGTGCGGGK